VPDVGESRKSSSSWLSADEASSYRFPHRPPPPNRTTPESSLSTSYDVFASGLERPPHSGAVTRAGVRGDHPRARHGLPGRESFLR
jgi:hypothetical protein